MKTKQPIVEALGDSPALEHIDTAPVFTMGGTVPPNGEPARLRGPESILTREELRSLGGADRVQELNSAPTTLEFKVTRHVKTTTLPRHFFREDTE